MENLGVEIAYELTTAFCFLKGVTGENDHTNYNRLTQMLSCSREVFGGSSVLCLQFPLSVDTNTSPPVELLTRLSCKLGK